VFVVDVAKAERGAEESVVAIVPAGCSPVRLAISPGGEFLYATARNSNSMLSFNTRALITDADHALVGIVPVGAAPVPVTLADSGKRVLVGNSNRFAAARGEHQDVTVIDAARVKEGKAAVLGKIPAQGFPRKLVTSNDGRTIFLGNFASDSLEIIDAERLAEVTKAK